MKHSIIALTLGVLLLLSCKGNQAEKEVILSCAIGPTEALVENYLVKIYNDGTINVTFGRKRNGLDDDTFDSVANRQDKILTDSDFLIIRNLKTQISKMDEYHTNTVVDDGWEIVLIIGAKKFHYFYGEKADTPLEDIIEKLIQVSPVKIDLHNWA